MTLLHAALLALLGLSHAAPTRVADVGFRGADLYVGITLSPADSERAYRFNLCSAKTMTCVPVSDCAYAEAALVVQVPQVSDPWVRRDLEWVFLKSDYSLTNVNRFFAALQTLLLGADPSCPVRNLDELRVRVWSQRPEQR